MSRRQFSAVCKRLYSTAAAKSEKAAAAHPEMAGDISQCPFMSGGAANRTAPPKSLSDMPGPKSYPIVGSLPHFLKAGGVPKFCDYLDSLYDEYGEVFKMDMMKNLQVTICDPNEYREKVFAKEGHLPKGSATIMWPFVKALETRGGANTSVAFAEGTPWRESRMRLQKFIFGPQAADEYLLNLDHAFNDASKYFPEYCNGKMGDYAARLGMEMISAILWNKQIGALSPNCTEEDRKYIEDVLKLLVLVSDLMWGNPIHKKYPHLSPVYKTFEKAFEGAFDRSNVLIKEVLEAWRKAEETGEESWVHKSYMGKLMASNPELSNYELNNNVGTMYFAGVDTTAQSTIWFLYNLARTPKAQERLHAEVKGTLKGRNMLPGDDLPYLSQCLKESFRVTPTASGFGRWITEDTVLKGYLIPKGTFVVYNSAMGRSDKIFKDEYGSGRTYNPDRWDEAAKEKRKADGRSSLYDHPFFVSNFGFGPRMCLGARIANMEIKGVIARLIQDYRIELDPPEQKIGTVMATVTKPHPVPTFKAIPRK